MIDSSTVYHPQSLFPIPLCFLGEFSLSLSKTAPNCSHWIHPIIRVIGGRKIFFYPQVCRGIYLPEGPGTGTGFANQSIN